MGSRRRLLAVVLAALAAALLTALTVGPGHSRADDLRGLQHQLGAQQSHQQTLSASIGTLNGLIGSLSRQISLVQQREQTVDAALVRQRAQLQRVRGELNATRDQLATLRHRLAVARRLLAAQLLSGYEQQKPDLMTVVLSANGFQDLLTKLDFLGRAQRSQQELITLTATAKSQAAAAAARLVRLRATDARVAHGTAIQVKALAGMNQLLSSKQDALDRARTAQTLALQASQSASSHLRDRIASVKAAARRRRLAAIRAARAAAAAQRAADAGPPAPPTTAGVPSGGWAIPYPIVLCESGGQNLPPNSAGASGYYQIIPSTWSLFGGTGPAAYLASKSEQDAVATRIWNGGAGASNWVCAGIVGIS
jgi:septal ring factor EnvC (AmiA/AmiB activator)